MSDIMVAAEWLYVSELYWALDIHILRLHQPL